MKTENKIKTILNKNKSNIFNTFCLKNEIADCKVLSSEVIKE
jgi:hypothetical protein